MKKGKFEYLFYLFAVGCFSAVLILIMKTSPEVSLPHEYMYVTPQESREGSSSNAQAYLEQTFDASSNETVKDAVTASSKQESSVKKYISSSKETQVAVSSQGSSETVSSSEEIIQNEVPATSTQEKPPKAENSSIVNINTASKDELMTLPGIGEVISKRIIETRDRLGGFAALDEIMTISGIGTKTYQKILSRITL